MMIGEMVTVSDMVTLLGVSRARVEYAIENLGLLPIKRIGTVRIYYDSAVSKIREAMLETSPPPRELPKQMQQ